MKGMITVNFFRKINKLAIAMVFSLILIGGLVRSTGSGMGCPDWPRCFGKWVPPVSESELPANYQDIYAHRGYKDTTFNAAKTWTEYLNRLFGASVGVVILILFFYSLSLFKTHPRLLLTSGLALVTVSFQGWLGAVVVAHNLHPVIVTLHMSFAFLLLALLIVADHYCTPKQINASSGLWVITVAAFIITSAQILLGTQVRETVDVLVSQGLCKCCVPPLLGDWFTAHKSVAWLSAALNGLLAYMLIQKKETRYAIWIGGGIIAETLLGLILYYFGLPAWAQPLHLLTAFVMVSVQFKIIMCLLKPRR